jgi:serine/threonine-protein kinase
MPLPFARKVLDDVLAALAVAHGAGILHRDIKPGNILFGPTGAAKVTDFGIAKTADAAVTMTGQVVGTMAYLSPERLMGAPAGPADDLYAAGVVGYEMLTGRRPFLPENPAALARAIIDELPPPVRMLRPDADPVFAAVIEQAMARDPALRFHDAATMRAALAGQPVAAVPRPQPTRTLDVPVPPSMMAVAPPGRPRRDRKLLWIGAAAAAVVLAIMVALFASASPSEPPTPVTTSTPVTTTTTPTTPPTATTTTPPVQQEPPAERPGKKPKHGPKRGD